MPQLDEEKTERSTPAAAAVDATDPLIGAVLDDAFRLERKLGEGGMGAVYLATQLAVERPVAVKVLRPEVVLSSATRDILIKRFHREAHTTSRLHHPNTVRLIHFGQTAQGLLYLVLELLTGRALSEVAMWETPLEEARAAGIARQIALSLGEAHRVGVVHRDLKPDNIFICDYDGIRDFVKVMDFGIARILEGDVHSQVTRSGVIIGTPKYMAPEQVTGGRITARTDLYALGVILYELLTGSPPFTADSAMALVYKHVHEPPPPLPQSVSEDARRLVERLLAKAPGARFRSAGEVAAALESLERGEPIAEPPGEATEPKLPNPSPANSTRTEPPPTLTPPKSDDTLGDDEGTGRPWRRVWPWVLVATCLIAGLVAGVVSLRRAPTTFDGAAHEAPVGDEEPLSMAPVAPAASAAVIRTRPSRAPATEAAPDAEAAPDDVADLGQSALASDVPQPVHEVAADAADAAPDAPDAAATQTRLVLTSKPTSRAIVLRKGQNFCVTPCDEAVQATGEHESLLVTLEGYVPATISVGLLAGTTVERTVVLELVPIEPLPGKRARPKKRPSRRDNDGQRAPAAEKRPRLPVIDDM